jgi:hypothetical protein
MDEEERLALVSGVLEEAADSLRRSAGPRGFDALESVLLSDPEPDAPAPELTGTDEASHEAALRNMMYLLVAE